MIFVYCTLHLFSSGLFIIVLHVCGSLRILIYKFFPLWIESLSSTLHSCMYAFYFFCLPCWPGLVLQNDPEKMTKLTILFSPSLSFSPLLCPLPVCLYLFSFAVLGIKSSSQGLHMLGKHTVSVACSSLNCTNILFNLFVSLGCVLGIKFSSSKHSIFFSIVSTLEFILLFCFLVYSLYCTIFPRQ